MNATPSMTPARAGTPDDGSLGSITRHFHPVLPVRRLKKKPVRVVVGGNEIVLFRDATGTPRALADRCPHRRAPLSQGWVRADGRLACPYHGWNFDGDGSGRSPTYPHLACDTVAYQVVEKLRFLWVAERSTPESALPAFIRQMETRTGGWAGFDRLPTLHFVLTAPFPLALDNYAEIEHVPFVHRSFGWSEEDIPEARFELTNFSDRTVGRGIAPQRPIRGVLKFVEALLQRGDTMVIDWDFRFSPVHSTLESWWGNPADGRKKAFSIRSTHVFVPNTMDRTDLYEFPFVKIHEPRLRPFAYVIRAAALYALWSELMADRRAVQRLVGAPIGMRGMRLGPGDKQVIHNRTLVNRIYLGEAAPATAIRSLAPERVTQEGRTREA
jgi:phenylpropionate dioxygenase-like ring-hydroxylating dioxygenase large terminal subunit